MDGDHLPDDHLPLDDVRVLDLTVARAGPTCVRQLADWGADVIRVDAPGAGGDGVAGGLRHGSDFQNLHRNKRSLTIDLKSEEGKELVWRLADRADVVVENMRPPVKERLGIDYETLSARNPRLVYGSISGFGQTGPYATRGGVDQIAQGMGGLMSVTGRPDGEPTRVGIPVSDLSAGLYLAVGILVALHDRERTGKGRWVQTSLLESMIAMMDFQAARWTMDGEVPGRQGNDHPTLVPMGCFATADGFVNIAGSSGRLLRNFCRAIGLPDLPADPRFDSTAKRSKNRLELNALISEQMAKRTSEEWVEVLNAEGVPCGPVYGVDQVFADAQVEHLGMATPVEHAALGQVDLVRNAITMSGVPSTLRRPAPDAGEHADEILTDLGLSADEIGDLRRRHVI
ncbi:MAG: L-carnitine dehydratase/bile acid-inducible protein F [uncultured Acidimicrobiales bacterium]|uniref:L-carnitine dehydratase/bile acid-inducible protein F n=1 Tax=uncultured Acidimicrobiales bacterium TaxID=310071 RepID=A0A6J4HTL3_9ACTN|nr:MAG: L-carnitine dehydratase/bile acid-inducible protein F [uncultured Acidimicrobiales bacterium]